MQFIVKEKKHTTVEKENSHGNIEEVDGYAYKMFAQDGSQINLKTVNDAIEFNDVFDLRANTSQQKLVEPADAAKRSHKKKEE